MTPTATATACQLVPELTVANQKGNGWSELDPETVKALYEDWYHRDGPVKLEEYVNHLKLGHTLPSPVCDLFRYRIPEARKQLDLC